jgi:hypothetical protein
MRKAVDAYERRLAATVAKSTLGKHHAEEPWKL